MSEERTPDVPEDAEPDDVAQAAEIVRRVLRATGGYTSGGYVGTAPDPPAADPFRATDWTDRAWRQLNKL